MLVTSQQREPHTGCRVDKDTEALDKCVNFKLLSKKLSTYQPLNKTTKRDEIKRKKTYHFINPK
jgi:hypothetical protein